VGGFAIGGSPESNLRGKLSSSLARSVDPRGEMRYSNRGMPCSLSCSIVTFTAFWRSSKD